MSSHLADTLIFTSIANSKVGDSDENNKKLANSIKRNFTKTLHRAENLVF